MTERTQEWEAPEPDNRVYELVFEFEPEDHSVGISGGWYLVCAVEESTAKELSREDFEARYGEKLRATLEADFSQAMYYNTPRLRAGRGVERRMTFVRSRKRIVATKR